MVTREFLRRKGNTFIEVMLALAVMATILPILFQSLNLFRTMATEEQSRFANVLDGYHAGKIAEEDWASAQRLETRKSGSGTADEAFQANNVLSLGFKKTYSIAGGNVPVGSTYIDPTYSWVRYGWRAFGTTGTGATSNIFRNFDVGTSPIDANGIFAAGTTESGDGTNPFVVFRDAPGRVIGSNGVLDGNGDVVPSDTTAASVTSPTSFWSILATSEQKNAESIIASSRMMTPLITGKTNGTYSYDSYAQTIPTSAGPFIDALPSVYRFTVAMDTTKYAGDPSDPNIVWHTPLALSVSTTSGIVPTPPEITVAGTHPWSRFSSAAGIAYRYPLVVDTISKTGLDVTYYVHKPFYYTDGAVDVSSMLADDINQANMTFSVVYKNASGTVTSTVLTPAVTIDAGMRNWIKIVATADAAATQYELKIELQNDNYKETYTVLPTHNIAGHENDEFYNSHQNAGIANAQSLIYDPASPSIYTVTGNLP